MWLNSLCFVFASFIVFVSSQGRQCDSSRQEVCVNLKECEAALDLLRSRNYQSLQQLTCGFAGTIPLVCCRQFGRRIENEREVTDPRRESGEVTPAATPPPTVATAPPTVATPEPTRATRPTVAVQQRGGLLRPPSCGFSNITNYKVVGGIPAKAHEFPWVVALGYKNARNPSSPKWLCGGTLITNRHVLTAGHCVHNRPDLYLARVGELDLYDDNDGVNPEDIGLVKARIHENYSPVQFTNDIAILTLERSPTNPWVWPICLPHDEPYRSNTFLKYSPIVAGWGALYFNGPSSSNLQYAEIPVVSNEKCKAVFSKKTVIDDRILCAGWTTGAKDACQGDSGGPLMYGKSEGPNLRFYQIGVVSYGFRCAEAGYPGVYTRVTNFVDWIQRNLDS